MPQLKTEPQFKPEPPTGMTTLQDQAAPMKPIHILGGVALAGLLLILVYSASTKAPFTVFGIAAMVAGASILAGGLLGFVFGIPRTSQREDGRVESSEKKDIEAGEIPSYRQNTNLEQISDWLTKILVGAGLTQISNMQKWISDAAQGLAPGFGSTEMSSVFAAATVLSYIFIGFLIGYLWTRLYFAGALHQADMEAVKEEHQNLTDEIDHIKKLTERIKKVEDEREKDERIYALVDRQLTPTQQAPKQEDIESAFQTASRAALVHILRETRHIREETWKTDKAKMERTIPIFLALTRIDPRSHEAHGQLGFTMKDKVKPDWERALKELDLAIEYRGFWKSAPKYLTHYELARGQCRIWLDNNFRGNRPSTPETLRETLSDLQIFHAVVGDDHPTWKDKPIQPWLNLNNLTVAALTTSISKSSEPQPVRAA